MRHTKIIATLGLASDSDAMIGEQLVARGLVARGAAVVLVSIGADLARADANYLKMQRL